MPPSSSNLGSGGLDDFDFADLGTAPPSGPNPYVLATREMPLPQGAMPRVVGFVVGAFLALIVGIVMAIGAFNMVRRTGLSSARTAAIMAIIPCFGGCVFPIGIWATVLLFTGSVKKDFYD